MDDTGADLTEKRRDEGFPRSRRIRRSPEIRAVMRRGKRKRTSSLDVFFTPSPVSRSRLGLVVPKHRRRIVDRNLLKRRLREIGRRIILPGLDEAEVDLDVLVRARREAYGRDFDELESELRDVMEALCSGPSSSA